jgi:hypothetical protein
MKVIVFFKDYSLSLTALPRPSGSSPLSNLQRRNIFSFLKINDKKKKTWLILLIFLKE